MRKPHQLVHFLAVCSLLALFVAQGQRVASAQPVAPANGVRQIHPGVHALVGGRVVIEPGVVLERATVVIRAGLIDSVIEGDGVPAGARVWDCAGLTVYPGLIDAYAPVGAPEPDPDAPGRHTYEMVAAERDALDGVGLGAESRKKLRGLGFTAAHLVPDKGVFRGSSALVSLGENDIPGRVEAGVIKRGVFDAVALESTGWGTGVYPGSKMGAIALVRQVLADSVWYQEALRAHREAPSRTARPAATDTLDVLGAGRQLLFDTGDELDVLRVAKVAGEFGRRYAVVGSGTAYRRLGAITALDARMIVPATMVPAPSVGTRGERDAVSLRRLQEWEQSPTNLRRLDEAGVEVSLTSAKLRDKGNHKESFYKNVRRAIDAGLSDQSALAMLTTRPARLLGVQDSMGRVARGMGANLVVVDGGLFEEERTIRDVWIDGRRYEIERAKEDVPLGRVHVSSGEGDPLGVFTFDKQGVVFSPNGRDPDDESLQTKGKEFRVDLPTIDWVFDAADLYWVGGEGVVFFSARVDCDEMHISVERPDGTNERLHTTRPMQIVEEPDEAPDPEETRETPELAELMLPLGAYGVSEIPEQHDVLIQNATVWTSGEQGTIEDAVLLVRGGKIGAVLSAEEMASTDMDLTGFDVIDAEGKHITPGLIDCHSHTGISGGVNEGNQAVTSEVRIADVINPDSVNWYREIAGGITTVNQLHGSANPIGGQNSVVKVRWGARHPDEMRFAGAPGGIKFALGENVKRSNMDSANTTRYPKTRMGVETLIRDRFFAAREYAQRKARSADNPSTFRRDLELEALAEILEGRRLVHCHSYRQDEILMLCRVAEEFGFRIGTFQHVLEGYKVAEAIKAHAIGGSAFSDWWAYKFEVYDAIPENGAIMHEVGVVVSFNSDSDELARRMNVEAAKAVKYGGVARDEALKFVTINPALQLGIDARVGSLEPGKDADFVIWSGDPLSSMSRCEQTWIDGRRYFSLEQDAAHREVIASERRRIMQAVLSSAEKNPGKNETDNDDRSADGVDSPPDPQRLRMEMRYDYLITNGMNPFEVRCGDCGCGSHNMFRREF